MSISFHFFIYSASCLKKYSFSKMAKAACTRTAPPISELALPILTPFPLRKVLRLNPMKEDAMENATKMVSQEKKMDGIMDTNAARI